MFDSRYPFGAFYLVALLRLLCVKLANSNFAASNMAHLSDRSGGAPGRSTEWSTGANEGRTACPHLGFRSNRAFLLGCRFRRGSARRACQCLATKAACRGHSCRSPCAWDHRRIRNTPLGLHFREDQSGAAALSPHNPTRVQFIQWLLDGTVVKRTPQCEGHLIPLGRSFAIGAIHVRGIQGASSCMTDSMHQPGHTRVKSSIGFN